jgi:hypothetical protein
MSSSTPERGANNPFRPKPRTWSTTVQVIGILHLVFGGLTFVFGLVGGVMQAIGVTNFMPKMPAPPPRAGMPAFPTDMAERLLRYMEEVLPFHRAALLTQAALALILSAILVIAGIGLLNKRPWGRKLSLAYGVLSIVFQIAGMVYTVAFMFPAMSDFYRQMEQEYPNLALLFSSARVGMWAGLVAVPVGLIYPIVVLVLMTRRGVVAVFAGEPSEVAEVERVEDRGDSTGAFTAEPPLG